MALPVSARHTVVQLNAAGKPSGLISYSVS